MVNNKKQAYETARNQLRAQPKKRMIIEEENIKKQQQFVDSRSCIAASVC